MDNFPEGKAFRLLGVDCLAGKFRPGDMPWQPGSIEYLTKGEAGGLVNRELSFAQALTLVCGAE